MTNRRRRRSDRSLGWGTSPLFSRRVLLSPPTRATGASGLAPRSRREARAVRPRLAAGLLASIALHGFAIVAWQGGTIAGGDSGMLLAALEGSDPLEVVRLQDDRPAAAAATARGTR